MAGEGVLTAARRDGVTLPWCVDVRQSSGLRELFDRVVALMGQCVSKNPASRPTAAKLFEELSVCKAIVDGISPAVRVCRR